MRDSKVETLRAAFPYSKDVANLSINNKENYYWIVKNPGYRDFTPRTMAGVKKETVSPALEQLANRVYSFIHDNAHIDYDQWHQETCNIFLAYYRELSGKDIHYGKAQKILNMTMKYIYCLPDSEAFESKFANCHMSLDSYTLTWFCSIILPLYNRGRGKTDKASKTIIINKSWSNLDCGNDENDTYSYLWLQNQIRKYLASSDNKVYRDNKRALTSFEAEFYIWPEQQFIQAAEEILKQGIYIFQSSYQIRKTSSSTIKTIRECLIFVIN